MKITSDSMKIVKAKRKGVENEEALTSYKCIIKFAAPLDPNSFRF